MNKTGIEYLDFTWNPIAMRCSPISAGCQECWHIKRAKMLANNPMIPEDAQKAYAGRSSPLLIQSRLEQPRKVKKPSMIGVQFMGDLFHEDVTDFMIDSVFIHASQVLHHTFLILTKRLKRMQEYFKDRLLWKQELIENFWFGVTAENQQTADERIPILLQIPAKVRFVSVEPMLSEINLVKWLNIKSRCSSCGKTSADTQNQGCKFGSGGMCHCGGYLTYQDYQPLNWVIGGPETGPGARPCPEGAIENLYEQSRVAGIPFFDKRENFIVREFPGGTDSCLCPNCGDRILKPGHCHNPYCNSR